MLRFSEKPNKVALAIVHAALTDALDWFDDHQEYPYGQTTHAVPPSTCSNGCLLPLTIVLTESLAHSEGWSLTE